MSNYLCSMNSISFLYPSLSVLGIATEHLGQKDTDSGFPNIDIKKRILWFKKYQVPVIY